MVDRGPTATDLLLAEDATDVRCQPTIVYLARHLISLIYLSRFRPHD